MDTSLKDIRKQQHRMYLKKKWLPTFYKKWKEYIKTSNNDETKFNNYLKDNYFKPVKNLSNGQLNEIPWEYQLRLELTQENLLKTEKPTISPNCVDYLPFESDFIPPLEYNEAKQSVDVEAQDDWNNVALNIAIMNSLKQKSGDEKNTSVSSEQTSFDSSPISYLVIIDLRVYGKDSYQPIYIDDIPFYLNKNQINIVNNKWNLVNSSNGMYKQDLEYIYSCGSDANNPKNKKFVYKKNK